VWTKWVNWQAGLMVAVIAIGAMAVFPGSRVPEIHNASQPFNFALVDPRPGVEDWPWWRGADGRNVAASDQFPTEWTSSDHDGWKVVVPGSGNATPIIWGQQLFLPTYETHSRRISLHCLHRKTGRFLWQTVIHQGKVAPSRGKTSRASSTPACDGQNVFIVTDVQDKLWVTAVDLTGQIVWQRDAGPYRSQENYSASPVFYKSLVIISADQGNESFLAALHRQTGDLIWRIKRPKGESFGSPVVTTIAGSPQLILGGSGAVKSYHPATGDELWTCRTSAEPVSNSVAFDEEYVFATRGQPNAEVICIKGNGSGDVTRTNIEWRLNQIGAEFTSPVYHGGLLYVLSDDGRLCCIQAASGKIEWSRQLQGSFSASPVIVRDYLFCANEAGATYFVSLGASNPQIMENALGGGIIASPIFAGDSLYIRTTGQLHRIAAPASEPFVEKPESKRRL
jgi:outer membrane protein assembly factor BamB